MHEPVHFGSSWSSWLPRPSLDLSLSLLASTPGQVLSLKFLFLQTSLGWSPANLLVPYKLRPFSPICPPISSLTAPSLSSLLAPPPFPFPKCWCSTELSPLSFQPFELSHIPVPSQCQRFQVLYLQFIRLLPNHILIFKIIKMCSSRRSLPWPVFILLLTSRQNNCGDKWWLRIEWREGTFKKDIQVTATILDWMVNCMWTGS